MTSSSVDVSAPNTQALDASLRAELVRAHFDYVWRLLRRLGLCPSDADDAAQEVFLVGLQKWEQIEPGRERAFLYACALNKARRVRMTRSRASATDVASDALEGTEPPLDELLDHKKAALLLDRLLDTLPDEQRDVFVLFEVEQLTLAEVAALLSIPRGTAASRLRLARARVRALYIHWMDGSADPSPLSDPELETEAETEAGSHIGDGLLRSLRGAS